MRKITPARNVLRAVVLTQYRRVTDRQMDRWTDGRTDGIAIANTAIAMQALRHAVKTLHFAFFVSLGLLYGYG